MPLWNATKHNEYISKNIEWSTFESQIVILSNNQEIILLAAIC